MAETTTQERATYTIPVPGITEQGEDGNDAPAMITMYAPDDGQYAVLLRVSQQVGARGGERVEVARNIGLLYRILDSLFLNREDKAWIDELLISGQLDPSAALGLVLDLLHEHVEATVANQAPKTGPVRRVAGKRVQK